MNSVSPEARLEAEIQAKGLTAMRITPGHIDELCGPLENAKFHVFPGTTLTVCCIELPNGFTVVGESACASPENFNADVGKKIAFANAREKVWALEGYALRNALWACAQTA